MKPHPVQQIGFTHSANAYIVEASAGTGKTWTIERLYIKALLEAPGIAKTCAVPTIQNILVVTFTNDATDELKVRLYSQIEKSRNLIVYLYNHKDYTISPDDIFGHYLHTRQSDYKKDVLILTHALQNFDTAAIFTIHGFCNKILRDYQFECQINAEFKLIKDKTEILKQIVLNFLRSQILTKEPFTAHIATVMRNLHAFFGSNSTPDLVDAIVDTLPRDLFKIDKGGYALKYQLGTSCDISFLTQELIEDKVWHMAELLTYLVNYIHQHYPPWQDAAISYDELIQKVADSITSSTELANKIFYKYPIAFIDEFQDTDSLQWKIFSEIYHLTVNSAPNKHSRGNVVLVGDPKQAIYRFRGADIDTYIEAQGQITQHVRLVHNYRSQANIMNFINQLFALSNQNCGIANSYLGNGIDYTPSYANAKPELLNNYLPTKAELEQLLAKYNICQEIYTQEVQIVAIRGATKPVRHKQLLRALTFEILALLNAKPSLKGKIAVLVTKNSEAFELVKYFANFGIKATELKLGNIFATTTASELYTILVALQGASVGQKFIQAITTKIFNLPLQSLANRENNPVLEMFYQRFFRYKQVWDSSGIFSLLYAILEDITADNNSLTNRELANLWQLAELLHKQQQKISNQTQLLFWFKERIKQAKSTDSNIDAANEELLRLENDDEQIIITTQHRAKGLEYEILFCPYFKNALNLDGQFDFGYKRPFFSNYCRDNIASSGLILDQDLANYIVEKDNKEIHRLNYVALTRAKSRIYIYLKQNTMAPDNKKYNSREKPDKLAQLFGYVKSSPHDISHQLFNYPHFFTDHPHLAIKDPDKFPGVWVYNRDNLTDEDLFKLQLSAINTKAAAAATLALAKAGFMPNPTYYRQSYSGLTKTAEFDKNNPYIRFSDGEETRETLTYKYAILNNKELNSTTFGLLFHELCEIYPFSQNQLENILHKYNVTNPSSGVELSTMLEQVFNYPLLEGKSLNDCAHKMHELEFNLTITNTTQIHTLISKYFGEKHPFSVASQQLGEVRLGFLVGYMDVCFEHNGKYWVLDYKTNLLTDYTFASVSMGTKNSIIASMTEHHYYLQYLLYLVALKRYLQARLKIADATDLIGGAIYYYVRGIYVQRPKALNGLFIDNACQKLINELDALLG